MRKSHSPRIGITADFLDGQKNRRAPQPEAILFLPERYYRAVESAGGLPLVLPITSSATMLWQWIAQLDGLLVSGGDFDIDPNYYKETPIKGLGHIKHERTRFELDLIRLALKCDLPIFGICGGAQAINVALGGSLYQDIASQVPGAENHQQSAKKNIGGHRIQIRPGTQLQHIVKRHTLEVNTTHHQAVRRLGRGLVFNAIAEDGLIEGLESRRHSFVLGVQWHPEALYSKQSHQRRIFSHFISACEHHRSATKRRTLSTVRMP
jgi:putative glutamine amidotransferase